MNNAFAPDLLRDRCILITGGGTGLGKAMGDAFMALGADLIICGRRREVLEATADEFADRHGRPVRTFPVDVRDAEGVAGLMDFAFADRPPDTLINNAAANFIARTETLSPRAVDAVLNITLHGAVYCTLEIGKRWIAAGRPGVVGSIVTSYAWHGSPYVVPSAIAKSGLLAMTRSLAVEWGGHGIRTFAIAPGAFPTEGAWERLVPRRDLAELHERNSTFGRPGEPDELARLAVYLVSDLASYIQGECVTIDGGRWLKDAGTFGFLDALTPEDWEAMRSPQRSSSSP